MRRPSSSWTGLGVLLSLCASCSNAPTEGSGTTENAGDSTANGESAPETNGETAETTSASGQTTAGSTTTNTTSSTTTSPGTTSTTTSPGTTESSEDTNSTDSTTETTTTDTTETGQDPNRGCDGEPLPEVVLTPVIEGLSSPIAIEFIEADPGYAYVALRAGPLLRVNMADPANGREELLNLNSDADGECGFLSFAFHPEFDGAAEQRFYISHNPECAPGFGGPVGSPTGLSVVSEYTLAGTTATFSREIINVVQPAGNHNGGHIVFGPDGYLYFGLGDGGGSNDQYGNGQNPSTALGSIIRVNVDNLETPPAGNLTSDAIGGGEVDSRILHWGLRNPWRFTFDRATGDLYIADVGQDTWEEVNVLPAGSGPTNFGWPAFEGQVSCPTCGDAELYPGVTDVKPVMAYEHSAGGPGQGPSVTGGFVYRGSAIPDLYGRYIYADYNLDWVRAFTWDGAGGVCDEGELITRQTEMVSFGQDLEGELYVVHLSGGTISRLDPV